MPNDVAENEVASYKTFHISHMKKEPDMQWLGDGMKTIHGKSVGFINVIFTDRNSFGWYFFTSMDGKLLLFVYSGVAQLWPALQGKAEKIMNSLQVKK